MTSNSATEATLQSKISAIPFYPFVFAVWPVIAVYSVQPSQVLRQDLLTAVLAALAVAAVLYGFAHMLLRDLRKAAVASLLVITWLYAYGMSNVGNLVLQSLGLPMTPNAVWLLGVAIVMLVGLFWLFQRETISPKFTSSFNTIACCATIGPIWFLGSAYFNSETAFRSEAPADTPSVPAFSLTVNDDSPDVYYLVFDRYARADVLASEFGHDNKPFLNELRKRGFYVADRSRSNYPKTEYSMSSALNMSLHGGTSAPKTHYMNMLAEHAVGTSLKENGYRYYHLGNMLDGIRANDMADENAHFSHFGCEFHDVMVQLTSVHPWMASVPPRDRALNKFDRLEQIASEPAQHKFVYAHFLLPHEPWKFDREGNEVDMNVTKSNDEFYVDQLVYTNKRILETIDKIQSQSKRPPIIVLQADEGPELKYQWDKGLSLHDKVDRRTAILSAFYLPGKDAQECVPANVTPVNTFRIVFREYFAADLEDVPNRSFYWSHPIASGKPTVKRINTLVDWTERLKQPTEMAQK